MDGDASQVGMTELTTLEAADLLASRVFGADPQPGAADGR
jgi:hypothetical protein